METQNGGNAVASMSVRTWAQRLLYRILNPLVGIGLLWLALAEAVLSLFFGPRFALTAIATSVCALAVIVALAGLSIDFLGSKVADLYDSDLKKILIGQRRSSTEPPANGLTN